MGKAYSARSLLRWRTPNERFRYIPYGETRSYKEQAIAVLNPRAVRAVARVNGQNRIAILIPCHRVIGTNGELVGYAGGIWRKKYLLELESQHQSPRLALSK